MDWIDRMFDWIMTPIHFEVSLSPFMILGIVFCVVVLVIFIKRVIWMEAI